MKRAKSKILALFSCKELDSIEKWDRGKERDSNVI
ncbi:hypothetical protein CLVI_30610 [Clostridium vincentii]|uniref:Uncharacterized protein n=1 Tax=Clostridium vincentii TaxID=52704 RepID=A0A2T0B922_9CLOT|nr:hypothetical protein CLVI_30610 [Clostridium vincentii]